MEKNTSKPELFEQFLAEKSNAAELNQLFDYFGHADQQELEDLIGTELEKDAGAAHVNEQEHRLETIHSKLAKQLFIKPEGKLIKMIRSTGIIKIAATILVFVSIGLIIYKFLNPPHQFVSSSAIATLHFDGKKATLGIAKNGVIYQQHGIQISKKADGSIVYMALNADSATASRLNTLETPNGGAYKITLGDGSIVMLNAGSKLIFPTDFRGSERKVFVQGEAFFNVAKNPNKPFIVAVGGSEIKVLGTQFNVSSYPETEGIEATLLEGSIQFSNSSGQVILKPNQQVLAGYSRLDVRNVSAEDFNAWTRGEFLFNDVPLAVVMQKLARWYNVEVDLATLPTKNLYIKISRKADIDEVLENISKATGNKFDLNANKIVLEE
ncbi:FecR family protein [Pedobacter agri]|uniref:FecR family protein n=1 Tax=Pedobacter agri TaxID=454586 RepID=UPI0029314571|nr:FecR domain-containing protein [Pedobacter agri]